MGTRMGSETATRPKPLVEIGGRPIIWHILNIYRAHGINDFVVCAGHAGDQLTSYFAANPTADWHVEVVDTGETTATGGRLRRIRDRLNEETFCMSYGDGVADVNVTELIAFHRSRGVLATVTAVRPLLPFGVVTFEPGRATVGFLEKPQLPDVWVNGGFFVIEPHALDYVTDDAQAWEEAPMSALARHDQLAGFHHDGFWQCMDTPRQQAALEDAWRDGRAPWKIW